MKKKGSEWILSAPHGSERLMLTGGDRGWPGSAQSGPGRDGRSAMRASSDKSQRRSSVASRPCHGAGPANRQRMGGN
jgi:hypothetical protein